MNKVNVYCPSMVQQHYTVFIGFTYILHVICILTCIGKKNSRARLNDTDHFQIQKKKINRKQKHIT